MKWACLHPERIVAFIHAIVRNTHMQQQTRIVMFSKCVVLLW